MRDAKDDEPREDVYIVGPAAVIVNYEGFVFRYGANAGVTIGKAIYEKAGVLNRRGCFTHRFTASELIELWARVIARGDQSDVRPRYSLPDPWRWPQVP